MRDILIEQKLEADLYVGLEGGFHSISLEGEWRTFLRGWAFVTDGERSSFGMSPSIEVPENIVKQVIQGKRELGLVIDEVARARDVRSKPYTLEDIGFTHKGDTLYAYLLAPQPAAQAVIKSLATNSPNTGGRKAKDVTILGGGKSEWSQAEHGLSVKLPERLPSNGAVGLKTSGVL